MENNKAISTVKISNWCCYLFGATIDNGIQWRPKKNEVPNWFCRLMQRIFFGNKWVKYSTHLRLI
jgi:hypothetical protein